MEEIEAKAWAGFQKWGGEDMLREVVGPHLPPLQRAKLVSGDAVERDALETARELDDRVVPDFEAADSSRMRGQDVPKRELDAE